METNGIVFNVQWKKKSRTNNEDVASIGIWDATDTTLNLENFKSYLCQNVGTRKDLKVEYVDSEGDEVPIDTEIEFQEALKFARRRSREGKKIELKLSRLPPSVSHSCKSTNTVEPWSEQLKREITEIKELKRDIKNRNFVKPISKPNPKVIPEKFLPRRAAAGSSYGVKEVEEKKSVPKLKKKLLENVTRSDKKLTQDYDVGQVQEPEIQKKHKSDTRNEIPDTPPAWFEKYMKKMKKEIVKEVTAHIVNSNKELQMEVAKLNSHCTVCNSEPVKVEICSRSGKKSKNKNVHVEVPEDVPTCEVRGQKLLKKLEKLHKQEKKLDSKLEKLENKAKRRESVEKKIQPKIQHCIHTEKKMSSRKKSNECPVVGPYLMDAILLKISEESPGELHVTVGEHFTKTWEIMNNGTLPWTDQTELRLTWGTVGFEPDQMVVRCPKLEPGEKGEVSVSFKAPDYPGTMESYWHFYHMGERFGHWISCAVVVEPRQEEEIVQARHEENTCVTRPQVVCDSAGNDASSAPVKILQEVKPAVIRSVNEEYESDEDDDSDASVVTASTATTFPLHSESEEDREFVVVSMPPCFNVDEPLPEIGNDGNGCSASVPEDELITRFKLTSFQPEELMTDDSDEEFFNSMVSEMKKSKKKLLKTSSEEKSSPNKSINKGNQEKLNDTANQSPAFNVKSSQPSAYHTSYAFAQPASDILVVNPSGQCLPPHMAWTYAPSTGSCGSPARARYDERNANAGPNLYPNLTSEDAPNDAEATTEESEPVQNNQQTTSPVHILPETLVNGAINVASSAFSTACGIIGNMLPRQGEAANQPATDRSTSDNLKLLVEMGFTNIHRNTLLLQRYDNNLENVIAELVASNADDDAI